VFKMVVKRLPWRGAEVKARLRAENAAGIRALAEFVAERARIYSPYDTSKPPDEMHLRDTIQAVHEADGTRSHVFASAPWAEPVEFGHRMRNGGFYPPNPFMRKAVRDGANAFPRFIGRSQVRQGYHHGRLMGATFE
jgi:hypothetical protein